MLETYKRSYLYITLLCLYGFLLATYFLLSGSHFHNSLISIWKYHGIIAVTLLYLIAILIIRNRNDIILHHVSIPSVIFLLIFGYYVYVGTIDHYLQSLTNAIFIYDDSITLGYIYIGVSLFSWIIGYLLSQSVVRKVSSYKTFRRFLSRRYVVVWDERKLFLLNLIWGVIGIVSFVIFYAFYIKGIPLIQGVSASTSSELRHIIMTKGHNINVIAFNAMTMALIFSGVYFAIYERSIVMYMVLISAIIAFVLWGARIYIAIPFLIFFPLLSRMRKYSLKRVTIVVLLIAVLSFIYGQVRNRNFFYDYLNIADRTSIERLADLHIGPEFRDTLGVISYLDVLQEEYGAIPYFKGIFLTAIPNKILALVGFDKNELFKEEGIGSGWLVAKITRGYSWGGVRPGIMGQTLMAFGLKGVVFVFFFLGVLFSQLDNIINRSYIFSSPHIVYIYILSALFSFSIIGTTQSVFSKFWYLTYGYLITYFFATKKIHLTESIDRLNKVKERR